MFSPQYKVYVDETIALVRSLCVKSEQTIDLQNENLVNMGYNVSSDPTTWKYYLNMEGRYHVSDSPITLVSSDTKETILLTIENLNSHPLTKIDYAPGGNYHKDLLSRYPNQRELILRIFNPVNKTVAIEAKDFTLLDYDANNIHPREISLPRKIQSWLYGYANRWHVSSFALSDPLYPSAALAVMWHNITLAIMNFRLEACLSSEVANFHLWAHLGSRYRLDRYKNYLSNRQSLYLYRNIDYLRFHVGKEQTMLSLQKYITAPTNIRTNRFDITQSDADLIDTRKPLSMFLKTKYDEPKANVTLQARYNVEHAYDITRSVGIYNDRDVSRDVPIGDKAIQSTVIDTIPTGLVELEVIPGANEVMAPVKQIKLHHWFYLASINKTRIILSLDAGDRGNITLTDKNAAILFMFILNMLKGGSIYDTVPNVLVNRVIPITYPTKDYLASILPTNLVENGLLDELIRDPVTAPFITDITQLDELCNKISFRYYEQFLTTRKPFGGNDKSALKDVMSAIYRPYLCDMVAPGTTYIEWIQTIDIAYTELTEYDYLYISASILKTMTGIDINDDGLSDKHRAMIEILKLLTSYGIIFVDGSGLKSTLIYDFPFMYPLYSGYGLFEKHYLDYGLRGHDASSSVSNKQKYNTSKVNLTRVPKRTDKVNLSSGLDLKTPNHKYGTYYLENSSLSISNVSFIVREE